MTFEDAKAAPQTQTLPHCDSAVLHAPGECRYCDEHADWQALRDMWGIAFTGHRPADGQAPCPSDARRGYGDSHAHVWGGNRPTEVDDLEHQETFGSRVMYGNRRRETGQ